MSLNIRRVVTGHDEDGKAIVLIDEICKNLRSGRERHHSCAIWSTGTFPADNSNNDDGALRAVGSTDPGGTVFRVVQYEPGVTPRNHRTDSIDYACILSGEIDMEFDGSEVHLKAGDVIVQRGTIHNWFNRGTEPCVIAFVLIAAHAAVAGGKTLPAVG